MQNVSGCYWLMSHTMLLSRRAHRLHELALTGRLRRTTERRDRHFSLGPCTHPTWLVLFSEPTGAPSCYDWTLCEIPQPDLSLRWHRNRFANNTPKKCLESAIVSVMAVYAQLDITILS